MVYLLAIFTYAGGALMYEILLNGKTYSLSDPVTVYELILSLSLDPSTVIVELNNCIEPKENWQSITLKSADQLEILHFLGGGSPLS